MFLKPSADGERYELYSATAMPRACGFLWNRNMMLHVNCRGYVKAQHMQPEPGKCSRGDLLIEGILPKIEPVNDK